MGTTVAVCDDSNVDRVAPICRENDLGLEIQAFHQPEVLEDPNAVAKHAPHLRGIAHRSMHGPFGDLCPGSFDPMVRQVARTRFQMAYDVARSLGVTDVVMHHGYVPGTSTPAGWLSRARDFWQEFLEGRLDIRFHLENHLERDPRLLSDVVQAVDRPNLDICLDVGHTHCFADVPAVEWIDYLGEQIGYVHLHDNHGKADEHLGLGRGTLPLLEICRVLSERSPGAIWALEVDLDDLEASVDWLRSNHLPLRST